VTNTQPSHSTAWLKGATGLGPPAIMWNSIDGSGISTSALGANV
jgi:hypothetical protein